MKKELVQKLISIFASISLLLQSFSPFVGIVPNVLASSTPAPQSAITFDKTKNSFTISVTTNEQVDYILAYKTDTSIEGAKASGKADNGNVFTTVIDAKVCSSSDCVNHNVIRGILKTKVDAVSYLNEIKFAIDDGKLKELSNETTSSFDLTDAENYWLEHGNEVTPIPTVTVASTATPSPTGQILGGISTTVSPSPTASVLSANTTGKEHVDASIIQSNACYVNSLNGCLTTNKSDYSPTEVVLISGYGFEPNTSYELRISSTNLNLTFGIKTDDKGSFSYSYRLDGTFRPNYTVELLTLSGVVVATTTFTDSNPSADLDQCANDPAPSSHTDGCDSSSSQWVNGNLGASKAVYFEGDSVPYRMRFDNLSLASHTVIIEWDTTKSSKHALDYLTSFDRTVTTANPCLGVSGCSSSTTFAIPKDPQVDNGSGSPISQIAGNFRLYGGTISSVSAYSYPDGSGFTGDKSARITITFTASVANPVLAWGGHIATRGDWGATNSAISIPGSPYHMRLIDLDGSGGNQDHSLSAEAVVFPGSITIIKQATPEGSTPFPFTASPSPLSNFNLIDDGTTANTHAFTNITNFQTYSVSETVPGGWTLGSIVCSVTSPNGGSQTVNLAGVSINLKEGENVTCTFNDTRNQVAPTVTTVIHNENHNVVTSVPAGSTVHDVATVSGTLGTPTGSVIFKWFTNNTCSGDPAATSGTFALSGGTVDASSFTEGPLVAGLYGFKAHYNGDSNYLTGDGACEPLTVSKVSPGIVTTPNPTSGNIGGTLKDSALLSGGYNPTGNIVFNLYNPSDASCQSDPVFTNSVSVSGNGTYNTSSGFTSNASGTYHWIASYGGDANNTSIATSCGEPVTISKLTSTTTTAIHDPNHGVVTSVDAGSTVHDSATVTGSGPTPTGNVNFTFYPGSGSCTGDSISKGTVALNGGVADPSTSAGPLNAGSYSFKGSYGGDNNYNGSVSGCESLTVNQITPKVSTVIHLANGSVVSGPIALGSSVSDEADVTGSFGIPTGNVDFTFYNNGTCTPEGNGAGNVALNGSGVASPSNPEGPLTTGSYSFKAHYNGDTNYVSGDSDCESLTVNKSDSTTVTHVHNPAHQDVTNSSVALGTAVHDSATVGTQVDSIVITGNVTYNFYANNQCTGNADSSETVTYGTESTPKTLAAGSYGYKADYSGDDNYNSSTGSCEPFSVAKADTETTTEVHDENHDDITDSSVPLGSVVHDSATVGTQVGDFVLGGNVTYHFFTDGACEGDSTDETVAVGDESNTTPALGAGSYSYQADYNGDDNYNSSKGVCEPFSVEKASPSVTTEIHNGSEGVITSETLDLNVHDKATVAGSVEGFQPTGNVDFRFFNNGVCRSGEGEGTDAGTVSLVDGIAHPSNTQTLSAAGHYSFQAHYSGDKNYADTTSACEPFTLSTLTVNKNTVGGDATFDYVVAGPTSSTPSITTSGGKGSTGLIPVLAGDYSVTEDAKAGWKLTSSSCTGENSPKSISLSAGDEVSCTFNNKKLSPILTISKSNNAGGNKAPGDNVTFTLTVTATQSAALNVVVTDLPAGGFKYRSGSWSATKNGLPFSISEPFYASPGKWKLENLNKDDVVVLTYVADISGSIASGLYKDEAWASGCTEGKSCSVVLASAVNPGKLSDNFVGTAVNIVQSPSLGYNVKREETGQVLGASTSLPATGARTLWVILASLLLIFGAGFVTIGLLMRKNWGGKLLKFAGLVTIFLVLGSFVVSGKVYAAEDNLSIRFEQPASPTTNNTFDINFVTLDILGRSITVKCFKKGPSDGSLVQFGSDITVAAGGNSGNCSVNSSVLSANGTYQFRAKAFTSSPDNEALSEIIAIDFNVSGGPGTPISYQKNQIDSCKYEIKFRTADDGGKTVKVEIYRSSETSFNADAGTRITTIAVGSNEEKIFTDTIPVCGKTYYYVIRAFDSAGNGSGLIGDTVVTVTTTTTTSTTTSGGGGGAAGGAGSVLGTQTTGGAIPVTNVTIPAPTGEVLGQGTPSGAVEVTTTPKGGVAGAMSKILSKANRPWILIIVVVVLGAAVYVFIKRKPTES